MGEAGEAERAMCVKGEAVWGESWVREGMLECVTGGSQGCRTEAGYVTGCHGVQNSKVRTVTSQGYAHLG